MRLLKLARGVLGTAVTWAVAWSVVAVSLKLMRVLTEEGHVSVRRLLIDQLMPSAQYGLVYGAALGVGFATLLFLLGLKSRSVSGLTMKGVGAKGATVGCVLHWWVIGGPVLEPWILVSLVLGAGCGTGTLAGC